MTEETRQPSDEVKKSGVRIDRRTGKPLVSQDDAYWQEHERRRVELGMSLPKYCAAHGLALSTYRLRVHGRKRAGATRAPSFVAIPASAAQGATVIEVQLQGVVMRLNGEAAERVLARVMERLA